MSDRTCLDCRGCCDGKWHVHVSPKDILREPALAGMRQPGTRDLGDGYLIIAENRICPFLTWAGCSIYDTRPDGCRAVVQGDSTCNESRGRLGLELIQIGDSVL